jgi:mono/diheme cytochrome c family protein
MLLMTQWKVLSVFVLVFGLAIGGAAVWHVASISKVAAATTDEKPKATAEGKADSPIMRGEYLVNVVARCGDCHTPRNDKGELIMARHLQGAKLWFTPKVKPKEWEGDAPDITMAGKAGKWSEEVMVKYLMTGLTAKGKQADAPMPAYKMTPEDAKAVTAYLRSLSGDKKGDDKKD